MNTCLGAHVEIVDSIELNCYKRKQCESYVIQISPPSHEIFHAKPFFFLGGGGGIYELFTLALPWHIYIQNSEK